MSSLLCAVRQDMRKLIVSNIMSLDGYTAGPGGDVMVLPMDQAFDDYNLERLRSADTLLLGRTTYDMFKGFWPHVSLDPEGLAARTGIPLERLTAPGQQELSQRENAIEKVVVSDSLGTDETGAWSETTEIVPRAEAHGRIAVLKDRPGGDILVFGSRTLWNDLLAAGLVDELHLLVGATVVGGGAPAFASPPTKELRLIAARRMEGSHNALLTYGLEAA